ncbi:Festuclavine dehydrogenase [Choanephora cucurbitarum]|uniref:Festuclavine dehydrogenase n=1 Tax=Choanephora cucurbitarum TaxID=101091 RepID=A0A1C7N958_9FUNG|nr:Festuclavine dehydrogenase [Choanephora cucurbitarum]
MAQGKVFVLGGTGSSGAYAVQHLLNNNVPVTLYSRDFTDITPFKEGIKGHERLIMIVAFTKETKGIQPTLAKYAYEAGVKQIIYVSSLHIEEGYRSNHIANYHYEAEEAIHAIPNRGYFISLRPGFFMSNLLTFTIPDANGVLSLPPGGDEPFAFISPRDIGEVAATIAQEDPEKHEDLNYALLSQVSTFNKLTETLTEVTGKQFSYKQISPIELYHQVIKHVPHTMAISFANDLKAGPHPTETIIIEILLGRKPHTLKEFFTEQKEELSKLRA